MSPDSSPPNKPGDRYLRFGCPRCMTRLRVRPSRAGTKQRCPRCQFVLVVPDAEQLSARGARPEAYPVFEGDYRAFVDSVRPSDTAAVADCPRCHTRTYTPEDHVGRDVACPDCGTMVVVSRRPEAPLFSEGTLNKGLSASEAEAYALLDTFEEPPERPLAKDQVYIPVNCLVCNTLMYGTLDQVGKHLICPDCNTPVVVPPPKDRSQEKRAVAHPVDDQYALRVEVDRPAAQREPAEQPPVLVVCSLCGTRMHAAPAQVGELITCPDCSTPVVVPRPEPRSPKPTPNGARLGEYGVGKPVERLKLDPQTDVRRVRIEPGDARAPDGKSSPRPSPLTPHPSLPFFRGIVSFLWHPGTWPRMLGLMAGTLLALPLVIFALSLMATPHMGIASAVPWVGAMVLFASGALASILWGFPASANLLAIVRDTAEGNDQIENWPEPPFLDWLGDFFQIFNSLSVSALCGLALSQVLDSAGVFNPLAMPLGAFFVFPVALMSMLEHDSPLMPLSLRVVGSLFSAWWAWALFYLETAVLVWGFILVAGAVLAFVGLWGLLLVGILGVPIAMVYFRLLGRLAWCCAQGAEEEKGEEEERESPPREGRRPPRELPAADLPAIPPDKAQKPAPPQKPGRSILDDDFSEG